MSLCEGSPNRTRSTSSSHPSSPSAGRFGCRISAFGTGTGGSGNVAR